MPSLTRKAIIVGEGLRALLQNVGEDLRALP